MSALAIAVHIASSASLLDNAREDERVPSCVLRRGSGDARVRLVEDADEADAVLFAESHRDEAASGHFLEAVRRHPVYRRHRMKCVVHSGRDDPFPLVPGFFPSIRRCDHDAHWTRSSAFLVEPNPFLATEQARHDGESRHLASFRGVAGRVPVRHRLLRVADDAIDVRDTGHEFIAALRSGDSERVAALKREYVRAMLASRFVLCPRGRGVSSMRLFEAMAVERAPVIISDDWVEPRGPDWAACSLRIAERDLERLPDMLRDAEGDAMAMGAAARRAWERWFSPTMLLGNLAEESMALLRDAHRGRNVRRAVVAMRLRRRSHAREAIRLLRYRVLGRSEA